MEKTKIVKEAVAAFQKRYGELPADAGYPVINEMTGCVYFSHSTEEWKKFHEGQESYSRMFTYILIGILVAVLAIIVSAIVDECRTWCYVTAGVGIFGPCLYAALVAKDSNLSHKSDIRSYDAYKKKFYVIEL